MLAFFSPWPKTRPLITAPQIIISKFGTFLIRMKERVGSVEGCCSADVIFYAQRDPPRNLPKNEKEALIRGRVTA